MFCLQNPIGGGPAKEGALTNGDATERERERERERESCFDFVSLAHSLARSWRSLGERVRTFGQHVRAFGQLAGCWLAGWAKALARLAQLLFWLGPLSRSGWPDRVWMEIQSAVVGVARHWFQFMSARGRERARERERSTYTLAKIDFCYITILPTSFSCRAQSSVVLRPTDRRTIRSSAVETKIEVVWLGPPF